MKLSEVFGSFALTEAALKAYEEHYLGNWLLSTKLQLYNYARDAFERNVSDHQALKAFQPIHKTLWIDWKLYRGGSISHWEAEEVLAVLRNACSEWGVEQKLTLMTLEVADRRRELQECFRAFTGIKRQSSGDYPWVAASKFLHFFNPRLFPIYDIAEVWSVALNSRFKQDYLSFCQRVGAKLGERSSIFNCTYTAMAAELMQNAHPELMSQFASWFKTHCAGCEDKHNVLADIHIYYATAFEIILLGATKI